MASLVSGLYDLISGDPTKKEANQLGALGGYETGTGEGLTTAGTKYEEDILSGDPTRIASSLAPEISTGTQQVEQQRLGNANFGTRSGGTTASTNAAESAERGNIINLEGGLQQGAAGQALSSGGNLLNQASGNINTEAEMAKARQAEVGSDIGGIASGVASIADPFLAGAGGGGGLDPASFSDIYQGGKVAPATLDESSLFQEQQI